MTFSLAHFTPIFAMSFWRNLEQYLTLHWTDYLHAISQHLYLSFLSLGIALLISLPLGWLAARCQRLQTVINQTSQGLRIIPSLALLFVLLPIIGIGTLPAVIALVVLATPPLLLNVSLGFSALEQDIRQAALGLGMNRWQLFHKIELILALPYLLNGIKLALVEIIASATLAAYIGAGGLGELILSGLGLLRTDLLVLGGASVALLSIIALVVLDLIEDGVKRRFHLQNA